MNAWKIKMKENDLQEIQLKCNSTLAKFGYAKIERIIKRRQHSSLSKTAFESTHQGAHADATQVIP